MLVADVLVLIASGTGFALSTICLAGSFYYLSQLVEEHASLSKHIMGALTVLVGLLHALLWYYDGFPLSRTLFSLGCLVAYSALLLPEYPSVKLTSPKFLVSVALSLANFLSWLELFSGPFRDILSASHVVSFYSVCVWLVPLSYLLSISVDEYLLPSSMSAMELFNLAEFSAASATREAIDREVAAELKNATLLSHDGSLAIGGSIHSGNTLLHGPTPSRLLPLGAVVSQLLASIKPSAGAASPASSARAPVDLPQVVQ
ncbi:hypothetical protein H696_01072 [Fonticula alba]|uniref:Protein TEX261 n=1 Tax=Fonticula alba TaxID=691883 RepID=A0A058ZCJ4_FONAL|nr:hypothetical protein H696_01072 [Fonticula alba]KCV71653.1 hypothetical protein H696_01072 [Fonticula alba]|eukprot:XP_009493231.1 hypothetical protein H696_01072 [Fonticula alba]